MSLPEAKAGLTKTANVQVTAREIDFVTRFGRNWEHLMEILGIMRPIKKTPGAVLKSKKASVTLSQEAVGEGQEIPYSLATVIEETYDEMTIEKYAKAVSIEAIKDHGYDVAVGMTDDEFLYELQADVTDRFYNYLVTGELHPAEGKTPKTFQMALAMAQGLAIDKFKKMHRTATAIVGFVNTLDFFEYLGGASITVQNKFGMQYIKDFMGYDTIILSSEIDAGQVIATPVENIVLYYVDPADSDFARAGLEFTTDGVTNLIGFHTQGNYGTAVSESFAIMGLTLFAEYKDGIAVVPFAADSSLGE